MLSDDKIYAAVAAEIEQGHIDKALWVKAFANSGGTEPTTESLYVQYRVEQLSKQIRPQRCYAVITFVSAVALDSAFAVMVGLIMAFLLPLLLPGGADPAEINNLAIIRAAVLFTAVPFALIHFRQIRRRRTASKQIDPNKEIS